MVLFSSHGPIQEQSVIEVEVKSGYFSGEYHVAMSVATTSPSCFSSMFVDG